MLKPFIVVKKSIPYHTMLSFVGQRPFFIGTVYTNAPSSADQHLKTYFEFPIFKGVKSMGAIL